MIYRLGPKAIRRGVEGVLDAVAQDAEDGNNNKGDQRDE